MQRKKVLVGISGGVDSAVSCALLKNEGYAVSAIFLRFWDFRGKGISALMDARVICKTLNIPLTVIDARAKFKKTVIKYFIDEYTRGKTPNPCVFCNEKMKFKLLFETADKLGIKMVATGHYAKVKKSKTKKGLVYKLFSPTDVKKDQTYFLYRLEQKKLARIIFPLSEYTKENVRKLAEKFQLPIFNKAESQDVCFMANGNLEKFLQKKINLQKGNILDTKKNILGEHNGLPLYTIGQRRGIKIGGKGPYFVISKNRRKNILIVTNDSSDSIIMQKRVSLKKIVWTRGVVPRLPFSVLARIRYRNSLVCAIIEKSKNQRNYYGRFAVPQRAVSPGQSMVFYTKNGEILGGGFIK